MKQGYAKYMTAQWHQLWAKIEITYTEFSRSNHQFFLSLENQESNVSNGSQLEVETKEIWSIETMLRKEHVVTELHTSSIPFSYLG